MGEVGVHLQHQPGPRGERPPEPGDVGGPEPFLVAPVQDADVGEPFGEAVGALAGAVGRAVVDDQDPRVGGQVRPRRRDERFDVGRLVVGRQDQPGGSSVAARSSRRCYSRRIKTSLKRDKREIGGRGVNFWTMTNAEIAAALDELGVLYELDGAVRYRVLAYSTAAKAIRESPVSVEELARAGRATEIPGVGKTLAEKIDALLDDRRDPRRGEAEGEDSRRPWSR